MYNIGQKTNENPQQNKKKIRIIIIKKRISCSTQEALLYSFNKHVASTYHEPGTVLGTGAQR